MAAGNEGRIGFDGPFGYGVASGESALPGGFGIGDQSLLPFHTFLPGSHLGSILPGTTDPYGSESTANSSTSYGFPYQNPVIPSSASNLTRPVEFSNVYPFNIFPLSVENLPVTMTNNFSIGSGLSYCSSIFPTRSQQKLLAPRVSQINVFDNPLDVESLKNQKGLCNMNLTPSIEADSSGNLQVPVQPTTLSSLQAYNTEFRSNKLKLILRKELSNSDVGSTGRIVLPKKEAQANLPMLIERDGIMLQMDDLVYPVTWDFKYRFWPNNKSRMYILENTGDFIKAHGLKTGDCFIVYRSSATGNYVVRGKREIHAQDDVEVAHCNSINECNMNGDLRCESNQQSFEQRNDLGNSNNSSISWSENL